MVERLKHAIEKARAQRETEAFPATRPLPVAEAPASATAPAQQEASARRGRPTPEDQLWASLKEIRLRQPLVANRRIVTHDKSDPAHIAFDVLRTRMIKAFRDNGWNRVAITSPRKGCGKTLVSANLALSFARQSDLRTLLLDMDLKSPELTRTFAPEGAQPISWLLSGRSPLESAVVRYGENLAIGLNGERVRDSAELIHDEKTGKVLSAMMSRLKPDVVVCDLPPMLVSDDAMAFLPNVDCVILVAAAGQTTAKEIEDCERMFAGHTNFLGVVLNKAEVGMTREGYEYV